MANACHQAGGMLKRRYDLFGGAPYSLVCAWKICGRSSALTEECDLF